MFIKADSKKGPYKGRSNSSFGNSRNSSYSGSSSNSSSNRRYSSGSSGTGASKSYSGGYKGNKPNFNYKSTKNRFLNKEQIAHSRYISKAIDMIAEPTFVPENNFYDFDLHQTLAENIKSREYDTPTKIQDQSIPHILQGKDVLGLAKTGSGKTAAFLIPMINKVLRKFDEKVLIVCPTRELANQISSEFRKFTKKTDLDIALIIGGARMGTQIYLLKQQPHFVVATPGRLIDLENRGVINLENYNNIILDEVDQMLAMGFVEDIKLIISKVAKNRQSLFFSATMTNKEEDIANTLLKDPIKVVSDKQSPLKNVDQDIVKVRDMRHKMEVLADLLKKQEFSKVLVFSATKHGADRISENLRDNGIKVDALHGDKSQYKRSKILAKFRENKIDVLVATDVAARGIDVPNITHVINFDEPTNYNDYIHRIGRTGRIGKKGTALTFVVTRDAVFSSNKSHNR